MDGMVSRMPHMADLLPGMILFPHTKDRPHQGQSKGRNFLPERWRIVMKQRNFVAL